MNACYFHRQLLADRFNASRQVLIALGDEHRQQKFRFSRQSNRVTVKPGVGFYSKVDLGIVKYHFELGAGRENFRWL